jgi:protein-L-isoaspartate O-methyltransferase
MDWKIGREDFYRKESEMFNLAADYYDRYRPGYPNEIIQTLIGETAIGEQSVLLEIGAGSGKATERLAGIHCSICCVDPGAELVARGNIRFRNYRKIRFHCARYEEFEPKGNHYDMICAFQAFHWVPQPLGYRKCAEELKKKGHLALVWNMYVTYDNALDNELLKISSKHGGFADFMDETKCEERILSIAQSIDGSALFKKATIYRHYWEQTYTADEYYGFCLTGNSFIQKSNEEKKAARQDIGRLAEKHGGRITRPYLCVLYLATKR